MPAVKNRNSLEPADLARCVLASWLLAGMLEFLLLPHGLRTLEGLEGFAHMSLGRALLVTCTGTGLFLLLSTRATGRVASRWMLPACFGILSALALSASFSWALLGASAWIFLALVVYSLWGWNASPEQEAYTGGESRAFLWITVVLGALFFLFVCAWTVARVYSFRTPTYDFGIFSQMFYNMKETGLPVTTLERDGSLSHFLVHMSPVYYLLLPFYCLFPTPATLQVLQAAVMTSALIPLWRLGKLHGLTGAQKMLLCAILLLYPAFSGGASYDIHENCFLTPLVLWLLWAIDRRSTPFTALFALLTLTVKEDAAVYVAVTGLWLTVKTVLRKGDRRELMTGVVLLAGSLLWFFGATSYLASCGDGVMTYRYENLLYGESTSLLTVVTAVLLNPMKALFECLDGEKLWFIAMTQLPLLCLPLLTRRYERYLLLIPYFLVNLLSDYAYQHSIFFQYTFGSLAFLLYLMAVNLADLQISRRRTFVLVLAGVVSAGCFGGVVVPKAMGYPVQCIRNWEANADIQEFLAQIPEDASVTATTFYTTFLSQREIIYDVRYASREHLLGTEYVVLSRDEASSYAKYAVSGEDGYEGLVALLEENGYRLWAELEGRLAIYARESCKSRLQRKCQSPGSYGIVTSFNP